jgi:hypothetical protein
MELGTSRSKKVNKEILMVLGRLRPHWVLIFICLIVTVLGCPPPVATQKPVDRDQPSEVSAFQAQPLDQRVDLFWKDPPEPDVKELTLSLGPNEEGFWIINPGQESFSVTGLSNGQEYIFTIRAWDHSGNATPGLTLRASPAAEDRTPPEEVQNIRLEVGEAAFSVQWDPPPDSDFSAVVLGFYSPYPNLLENASLEPQETEWGRSGLITGEDYSILLKTRDLSGNLSEGELIHFTPTHNEGGLEITLILGGPDILEIDLQGVPDRLDYRDQLTVQPPLLNEALYWWLLDGVEYSYSPSLSLEASQLEVGRLYDITLIVSQDGMLSSSSSSFLVTNSLSPDVPSSTDRHLEGTQTGGSQSKGLNDENL